MKELFKKIVSFFNFSIVRRYGGGWIVVPYCMGMKVGISGEAWMFDVLKKLLPQTDGSFIDVGVNLGQTLIKVKRADLAREYIGFEPNSVCVTYVNRLIEANNFKNCTLIPCGLFPETKLHQLNLYQSNNDDSSASMIKELRPVDEIRRSVFVPVTTYNPVSTMLGIQKIGVLKIDVEGAELEVFKTMLAAIDQDRPPILVEILPMESEQDTEKEKRQREIEQIFTKLGYQFFQIKKTAKRRLAGLERVSSLGQNRDLHLRDYLIIPSEAVDIVTKISPEN